MWTLCQYCPTPLNNRLPAQTAQEYPGQPNDSLNSKQIFDIKKIDPKYCKI